LRKSINSVILTPIHTEKIKMLNTDKGLSLTEAKVLKATLARERGIQLDAYGVFHLSPTEIHENKKLLPEYTAEEIARMAGRRE
jgi:hypothetical protein